MRNRISMILATLILAAMLLAACGAEETRTEVPGTDIPQVTDEATAEATEPGAGVPGTETVGPADGTTTPGIPVTGEEEPSRLSNQLDFNVWNQNGEQIGEVDDMVLDLDETRVAYVVVGTGGFLDLGEKQVLVPWDSLELQTGGGDNTGGETNAFILQVDQELFENAPDVDLNAILPEIGQPAGDWDNEIRSFWGSGVVANTPSPDGTPVPDATATVSPDGTPAPEGTEPAGAASLQGVVLASDVLGAAVRVQGEANEDDGAGQGAGQATATPGAAQGQATATPAAGLSDQGPEGDVMEVTVEDMIVDIDTGQILYIVINTSFDEGERWIPVPLGLLQWDADNQVFVLNVAVSALRDAPFFQDGQLPDTTVDGWQDEFDAFWESLGIGVGSGAQATPTP